MDKDTEQFINTLRKIKLSDKEKQDMRARLLAYSQSPVQANARPVKSPFWHFSYSMHFSSYVTVSLIVLFFIGGGLSYAAEGSLPGQALYPFKLYVNEGVRGVFSAEGESQAAWQATIAERRLTEATELEAVGKLDEKAKVELGTAVLKSVEKVKQNLSSASSEEGSVEIISKLEASLRAHETVLTKGASKKQNKMASESATTMMLVAPAAAPSAARGAVSDSAFEAEGKDNFEIDLHGAAESVSQVRVQKEEKLRGKTSVSLKLATRRMNTITEDLVEVEEFISENASSYDTGTHAFLDERLMNAHNLISQAQKAIQGSKPQDALELLQAADQSTQEASVTARTSRLKQDSEDVKGGQEILLETGGAVNVEARVEGAIRPPTTSSDPKKEEGKLIDIN